jgi:signal transduction histidine kinase
MVNSESEFNDQFYDLKQRIKALETELAIEKLKSKKFEKEASSSAAAGSSGTDKTQFIAKLTHELRTPLNGILGMCDLLLKTSLNGEQRDQALVINESARSLLELINDFLDFSRIESGKAELEIIDFELVASVEAIADLLAEAACRSERRPRLNQAGAAQSRRQCGQIHSGRQRTDARRPS